MTLNGSLATMIVFFTLAGTNASGESATAGGRAPAAALEGSQRPNAEEIVGAVGHRRTLALHRKRKRHGKQPAGSTPADLGAEPDVKNEKDKTSDEGDTGDETPPETSAAKKDKASGDGDGGDNAEGSSEPAVKKKKAKAKASDEGGPADEGSAKAEKADETGWSHPEALSVAVGPRVMARSLTYEQDIYGRNQRYSLPAAPMLGLAADFYPAALFMDGFAANLGLTADVGYLLPVVSTPPPAPPGSYGARSLSWSAGAKVRLPSGVFATVAYGKQRYELASSGGATGINVPTTDYTFVRGGAGIRYLATSTLSLMANASYLHCLGLGPIGAAPYYPKGTGAAFEAGVAVGVRATSMVEIRGGIDVRRYGLAFHQRAADFTNPQTDPAVKIAGGAVDQYISTWVAVAILMDAYSSLPAAGAHGVGGAPPASAPAPSEEEAPADQ